MTIHTFIDTNILLNLYSFPDDKLDDVDELINQIGEGNIIVHLPKQVENEFERNRESKLQQAVVEFKNAKFPTAIPNHMRGTETAKQYEDALKNAEQAKKSLVANATGLAFQKELNVDKKLAELFAKATRYDEDAAALDLALVRMHRGNPPGKVGNVGDRYNWEILLKQLPEEDLYIVSKDGDYASPLSDLDKSVVRPMTFLADEWARRKDGASLYIYTTIRGVLGHSKKLREQPIVGQVHPQAIEAEPAEVPEVPSADKTLAEVPEVIEANVAEHAQVIDPGLIERKDAAIVRLLRSETFAETHACVAELTQYRELFAGEDATKMFNAAFDNNQINWIITDSDVYDFYVKLLNDHFLTVDGGLVDAVIDLLDLAPDVEETDESEIRP
ncbi:DUF4935 domain-containing protein [Paraburkholderia hospita]|nr:DUF4935 domain-containing protein [Paraburkholderia hospita]